MFKILHSRHRIRANLFRLLYHLFQLILLQTLDLDLHIDTQTHVQRLHIAHKMHRRVDHAVFDVRRHFDTHLRCASVHGRLEASSVTSSEELFWVRLALVAGTAEDLGHGELDIEVLAFDAALSSANCFCARRVEYRCGFCV
ncbi:hypothetical protein FCULG_00004529 [Fusarium culmorum]|uniref:Secreted protein n=1 Tax=Fusarium culmorum TaxID=5516 RepID=A0A2T4HCJ8_FUSCU|nr:hypothetical protein FCULG_00004529 [Fusarium culmorum]